MGLGGASQEATNLPYINTQNNDTTAIDVGGHVIWMIATAALKYGDAVYVDGNGGAAKSTTIANYLNFAGFVVGGRQTNLEALTQNDIIGITVANAGELVLVALPGSIVWGIVGAATTTTGARVVADGATAGRIRSQAASSTAYTIGTALDTTATAGAASKILVQSPVSVTLA